MGRGLSQLQKSILGLAYGANRQTQGKPAVKCGELEIGYQPVDYTGRPNGEWCEFNWPELRHSGPPDMFHQLAISSLYGIPMLPHGELRTTKRYTDPDHYLNEQEYTYKPGLFDKTPEYKRAKAAVTRAIRRLQERGLMLYSIPGRYDSPFRWGYVLSPEGFEIGAEHEIPVDPATYVAGDVCGAYTGKDEPLLTDRLTLHEWVELRIVRCALVEGRHISSGYSFCKLAEHWVDHEFTDTEEIERRAEINRQTAEEDEKRRKRLADESDSSMAELLRHAF